MRRSQDLEGEGGETRWETEWHRIRIHKQDVFDDAHSPPLQGSITYPPTSPTSSASPLAVASFESSVPEFAAAAGVASETSGKRLSESVALRWSWMTHLMGG